MGCLILVLGLVFPRVAIFLLWLFYDWFQGVYDTFLLPLLGFLFLPYSLLWFTFVARTSGHWGVIQILILAMALVFDLASYTGPARVRRERVVYYYRR